MAQHAESLVIVRLEDRGEAGRVAHVLVNNPEKRNALGKHGKEELIAAFEALALDPHLRVAVLTGAGDRSFIGGADIAEMAGLDPAGAEVVSTKTHLACDAIRRLPVPVIARVNGYCLGAGMEIAASCDMRVGVETARFGMPEVKFGIPSGMEACLLPGLIGWGKTRELVFTGEMIDAQEAHRCGFLDRLVPAGRAGCRGGTLDLGHLRGGPPRDPAPEEAGGGVGTPAHRGGRAAGDPRGGGGPRHR